MSSTLRWSRELDAWLEHRPVLLDDILVVRSGGDFVAVDAADGALRWSTAFDPNGNTGQFVVRSGDVVVGTRNVADRTVLAALDSSGAPIWEVATGVIVVDAVAVTETEVLAFGGADGEYVFLRVDSTTGAVDRHVVPWLPDRVAVRNDGLIGSKRNVPGLVRFDEGGVATHRVSTDPVYGLAAAPNHVAIAAMVDDRPRLRLLSTDLETRWDQPASSTIVACDASAVACTARADDGAIELLEAESGGTVWVSPPLADEFVGLAVFDDVVAARGMTELWALDRRTGSVLSEHLMGAALLGTVGGYWATAMKTLAHYSMGSA